MSGEYIFCAVCHNLLTLNTSDNNICYRLECPLCPYYINITRKVINRTVVKREDRTVYEDKVVDLEKENERRMKTQVICPICSHTEAYFNQMQTRSADEPMTNFYECANEDCGNNWRD